MQSKRCLLFVVFLLIVIQSKSLDFFGRKGGSALERDDDVDDDVRVNKQQRTNDGPPSQSSQRRNRYPSFNSPSNNYRSRSRWPSSYDDRYASNERSPYGYGLNNVLPNFPGILPPSPFESDVFSSSGPNCNPLMDTQYPLFSDICGAVPQARYSLPNAFGHLERWQIAQVLTSILDPTTPASANPVCARSLRLLLCPLLFPPCQTRYEAPPVLPCQQFCRVVKNQCAAPSLDLLPCDFLPATSDLCPVNPTPYSSLLSSFGQPSPFAGGLSPPGVPQSPLSSLLAQSAFSSVFPQPDMPSPFSSRFSQSPFSSPVGPSSPAFSSLFSSTGLPLGPMNPFMNSESFLGDTLTPILVDFPPLQQVQRFSQGPRFFPRTRSATEKV